MLRHIVRSDGTCICVVLFTNIRMLNAVSGAANQSSAHPPFR
jgi:hypothetical protein